MKRRNLLVLAVVAVSAIIFSSYKSGPANNGYDCTGAETGNGNFAGCGSSGCHGSLGAATTGIAVTLELDSAGTAVTSYKPGVVYSVKISGTNNTSNSLPKFGFQVTCIQGSTAQATPTNAGTFASTGLPTNVRYEAAQSGLYVTNIVEHKAAITATSGTGGSGTTYVESFNWTAPVAGTGTVSFWGVLNAVNGDGNEGSADKWNTNHLTITEQSIATGITEAATNSLNVSVFPNPATNYVQLQMNNAENGVYELNVFDVNGKKVASHNVEVSGGELLTTLNSAAWVPGMYLVQVSKNGVQKVVSVVKN